MRVQADVIENIARVCVSEYLPLRGEGPAQWSAMVVSTDDEDGLYVRVSRAPLDEGAPVWSREAHAESYIDGKTLRGLQYTKNRGETVRVVAEAVAACVRDITNADRPCFRIRTKPYAKRLVRGAA